MATEIYMVEGDTAPTRQFTIKRDSVAVDVTGATVKIILSDTSTALVTNAGHQTCTLLNAAAGLVSYTFIAGDIASANVHFGDIQITYNNGQTETDYDRLLVHVRPKASTVS